MKRTPLLMLMGCVLFYMLAVTTLLVTCVLITAHISQQTQTLLLDGKTAAAKESKKATGQIRVILCDSLLIDRTELKTAQQAHIAKIAEAMIETNCQGVTLP